MFIVRGLKENGDEVFYTGRAGDGWIHTHPNMAFTYALIEGARRRALAMNKMTDIHGVRFIAMSHAPVDCMEVSR